MPAIFFDIDGTLVDYGAAEHSAACLFHSEHGARLGQDRAAFLARWQDVTEKHFERYLSGELSYQGQRRARLREIFGPGQPLADAQADALFDGYLRAFERSWQLYPDVADCLASLAGCTLGIISNGDSVQQRQKLDSLGIAGHFTHVLISGDIGVSKPDPAIFRAACAMAGRAPSACLYVGDKRAVDAEGAARAGLAPVWLNRLDGRRPDGLPTIHGLPELHGHLASWRRAAL